MPKLYVIIEDIELTHTDGDEVIIGQDCDTIITEPEFMTTMCVKWLKHYKPEMFREVQNDTTA